MTGAKLSGQPIRQREKGVSPDSLYKKTFGVKIVNIDPFYEI